MLNIIQDIFICGSKIGSMDVSSPPVGMDKTEISENPSYRACASQIIDSKNDMSIICCRCSADYTGASDGVLPPGNRTVIIKPDNTTQVLGVTGHEPRVWVAGNVNLSFSITDNYLEVICAESGKNGQEVTIRIHDIYTSTRYRVGIDQKVKLTKTEDEMHRYIISNPEIISDEMMVKEHEKELPSGRKIDIFGSLSDTVEVIVEVKKGRGRGEHVDQLAEYVRERKEQTDNRIEGYLICPSLAESARQSLSRHGFTHVSLSPETAAENIA